MQAATNRLIWIDLEMTGLLPDTDRIIEIATIVTDTNLEVLAEGPVLAIHQPQATMNAMDEWNTRTHGSTGLTRRVEVSEYAEAMAADARLSSRALSSEMCQGVITCARPETRNRAGSRKAPCSVTSSISFTNTAGSTTTPGPIRLTLDCCKMPEGTR